MKHSHTASGADRLNRLVLGLLVSCTSATTPLPRGSQSFVAPPAYGLWWTMTEACSGRTGQLSSVRWYRVPGASELPYHGDLVDGYWLQEGNRIVLAGAEQFDGPLVRHEMLHALLGAGQGPHRREQFLEKCGGIVVCEDICLRDAGLPPAPGRDIRMVSPDSIVIKANPIPESPSASQFSSYFAVLVTAHNPRPESVVVALPLGSSAAGGVSFGYHIASD